MMYVHGWTQQLECGYHTERPADDNAELWDYRVAMLDAIFYRP
jgi:hypothetical protein